MPKAFDDMVDKIWKGIKGTKNPRTGKPFTESDAYAIATAQWKKGHGGKAPARESLENWKILEFVMPIIETTTVGDDFLVRGVCINETTTRNGIKYTVDELENAAKSFRSKPMLLDHENKVGNIVGRTTENVNFNHEKKGIEFEGRIVDKDIQTKINQGLITDVSIGASVKDLVEEEDGSRRAVGLEGMEISFVAVPGDPNANLAQAMENSFMIKEKMETSEDFIDELELDGEVEEEKSKIKEVPIIKVVKRFIPSKTIINYYT